jgi:NADPH2:quinone reductase
MDFLCGWSYLFNMCHCAGRGLRTLFIELYFHDFGNSREMTHPTDMQAVVAAKPGGPEVLNLVKWAVPPVPPSHVLLKIVAAGINRPDILQRQGLYPAPKNATPIFGLEASGTVIALGEGANRFSTGMKVMALTAGGGYADYAAVHEGSCLPIPANMDLTEAACVPETFLTVWHNVFQRGALRHGETLLVHGGASGIGATAIQLAKAFGARVIITAGSDEKCAFCRELGADIAINYREQDFADIINMETAGRGADVILDMVGGGYMQKNLACAAEDGRIVQIAFLQGPKAELNLLPLMLKRLTFTGSTLRPRSLEFKAALAQDLHKNVWPLFEQGRLKIPITARFPLRDAAAAHRLMESEGHMGKIVLLVDGEC